MKNYLKGHLIDLDDYWDGSSIKSLQLTKNSERLYGCGSNSLYIFVFDMNKHKIISKSSKKIIKRTS